MAITPPSDRIWWRQPIAKVELIWIIIAFTWGLFMFRAAAGVCLGIVYAFRGLGIAVGAHTLWNLYAVLING